jgi:indole-3-glycerol phosphate synthase
VSTILDTILAVKREEVEAARAARSLANVDANARAAGPTRGLAQALRRPPGAPMRVLAEIKRASPSAGPIRPGADPAQIAEEYASAGAAAISVLTDKQFFDGDLSFLAKVRERVALPLLRKDFVVDAYQIAEARAAGADAVLLIVAALEQQQLVALMAAAKTYELDALVEVHDVPEAERAARAGATLIGVNHRDLRTMKMDMTLTSTIAKLLPDDCILVGESGIRSPADVRMLDAAGADAILVGEHLMRAPSPGAALRELMAPEPARGRS